MTNSETSGTVYILLSKNEIYNFGAKNKIPCKHNEPLFVICSVHYANAKKIIAW